MHHHRPTTKVALGAVLLATSLLATTNLQSFSLGVDAFIPASTTSPSRATKSSASIAKRSSSLSYAASLSPESHEAAISFLNSDDVLQKKRQSLKRRLLDAADEYKIQRQIDGLFEDQKSAHASASASGSNKEDQQHDGEYSATRLLRRIVSKVAGSRKGRKNKNKNSKRVLTTDKFRQKTLDIGDDGRAIIDLAEELIKLNPTPNPTYGFKRYGGGDPTECKLGGQWQLRFTTAADASFDRNEKRGKISTSQEIDCAEGTLTNVVDFEHGKLGGFRVVVEGSPVNDAELDLTFRRVNILRKSRFPRLFGKLSVRLPSRLLRRLNRDKDERGPYLTIKYLDDDFRIHQSGTGNYFIQSRVR
mmetsp:Transcript_21128/g.60582  ORF Transcript_21128/g.60582 Transcript_21128/m.60582 type:complete len:361 (+) Transcript_21128:130-1212(+)